MIEQEDLFRRETLTNYMADKIIFLDLDGVLNPVHYMNALHKMWKASFEQIQTRDEFGQFFLPQNCEALKRIIDETGADIVICSTWRFSGLKAMQEMWEKRGLAGNVIDVTPSETEVVESGDADFYDTVCRGMEIAHWIKKNNFTGKYVIIDDTADMLDSQQQFFIHTNGDCGLTVKEAIKAISILN